MARAGVGGHAPGRAEAPGAQLAELMEGAMGIDPRQGEVSRFSPAGPLEPAREAVGPEGGAAPGEPPARSLSILLAEDTLLNRLFLARTLESAGHRVRLAENGEQALDLLAGERFDLVLMDIQMPVMDGIEAIRRIRQDAGGRFDPAIPVIALTAYAMKGDRERFLGQGMTDYLAKPIEVEVLYDAIAGVMAGTTAAAAAAPAPAPAETRGGAELFDPEALGRRFSDRSELWRELVDAFAAQYTAEAMRDVLVRADRGDLESVGKVVHKLKGVLGTICAETGSRLAGEVLAACLKGDRDTALARLEPLAREVERVLEFAASGTAA
jgi:CheY-like chemotaxis protein